MKRTMLDYLLKCPEERKRLHIQTMIMPVMNSSDRISREGGYNFMHYYEWNRSVNNSRQFLQENLIMVNIINSSLLNWFDDFKDFILLELNAMSNLGILGHSLSIESFIKLESIYRSKTIALFEHIWYRGSLFIMKQFKYLRRIGQKNGKWTFNGFKLDEKSKNAKFHYKNNKKIFTEEENESEKDQSILEDEFNNDDEDNCNFYLVYLHKKLNYVCNFDKEFDYYSNCNKKDIKDIRDTPSYKIFSQISKRNNNTILNSFGNSNNDHFNSFKNDENGWKMLSKSLRKKIQDSVAILMGLQLRSIVENSMKKFENFFLRIPTMSIFKKCKSFGINLVGLHMNERTEAEIKEKFPNYFDRKEVNLEGIHDCKKKKLLSLLL